MSRNYYIFQSGMLRREGNTVYFENAQGKRALPVEDMHALYVLGEVTLNTKFLDFLDKKGIMAHFFDYYEYYSGSFVPRAPLQSGFLVVQQAQHYLNPEHRMKLAREFVTTAADNILRNLKYYHTEVTELDEFILKIEEEKKLIDDSRDPLELMSVEGRIRDRYYQSFNLILNLEEPFEKREKRPPSNPINTLISFGNGMLYATVLNEIYQTQLNPTISFLHEPSTRRFSLSLDISEVFKPLIVDRIIFKLVNNKMLKEDDYERELKSCYLKESGRKVFVQQYEERLNQTFEHRKLKKHVSYRQLIRLECYKLAKHFLSDQPYEGFRASW
jgi:CRISPR-associated protein Cas1